MVDEDSHPADLSVSAGLHQVTCTVMCEIRFRKDKFLSECVLQHTCKFNAFSNRFLRKLKTLLNEYRTLLIIDKIFWNSTPTRPPTRTPAINSNYFSFPLRVRVSGVLPYHILALKCDFGADTSLLRPADFLRNRIILMIAPLQTTLSWIWQRLSWIWSIEQRVSASFETGGRSLLR